MQAKIPTLEQVAALEAAGLVSVRPHNELPLRIVNYTPRAQYERAWTPELLQCRGLVFDDQWQVVARSLPKFFNYEEHLGAEPVAGPLPQGPFTVTEKHDGSLGILFKWKGNVVLATRGSFHSEQAERGMEILKSFYGGTVGQHVDEEHTHLFEIIYPENRIVVNYGQREALVWLTSIRLADGIEVNHRIGSDFGGNPSLRVHDPEELRQRELKNAEGYVLRYNTGQRVKIKFAEYVRLHRLVTGLSTTSVWEHLAAGGTMAQLLDPLPDEWMDWARNFANELSHEKTAIYYMTLAKKRDILRRIGEEAVRKAYAAEVLKEDGQWRPLLFLALDGNLDALEKQIWKQVKPLNRKPVTAEEC